MERSPSRGEAMGTISLCWESWTPDSLFLYQDRRASRWDEGAAADLPRRPPPQAAARRTGPTDVRLARSQ